MMDFDQNVQKPWVFEAIDFIGANAMSINTRPLTGAITMFMPPIYDDFGDGGSCCFPNMVLYIL